MQKLNNKGISSQILLMIVVILIAVVALIFGVSSYESEQKYKNDDQSMIAVAVQNEENRVISKEQQKFHIEQQNPFKSFSGPADYGDVTISYPKNWSAYVDLTNNNNDPIDAYFNPNYVPSTDTNNAIYALRFEVLSSSYSSNLSQYTNQQQQQNGSPISITPYQDKKVPQDVGSMLKGDLFGSTTSIMVMLPLRTNTIEVWSENPGDFNLFLNQILPTLTFNP